MTEKHIIAAQSQASQARATAMNVGRAFSWVKTQQVQKGVYLVYTQDLFTKYVAK